MERRELLGVLGATAAGLAAMTSHREARADHDQDDIHEKCAKVCGNCAEECNEGFHHCFKQVLAGKMSHAKAMHLCVDCGEICSTSAQLVARMSPLMTSTCRACAESCDACVHECEKLDDPAMKETIAALRQCAESCREMVKSMSGH